VSTNEFYTYNNTSTYTITDPYGVINLVAPADGATVPNETIQHKFYYTHGNDSTASCGLYYNGTLKNTITANNNTNETITATQVAYGTYIWKIKCDFSSGAISSVNRTLTKPIPKIGIIFKDEQNQSPVVSNITVSNGTHSSTTYGVLWYNQTYGSGNPLTGFVTADYWRYNSEYRTRYYTLNEYQGLQNFTFWQLRTTEGIVVRFHIIDIFGNAVPGAMVEAYKNFGGSWDIVDSELSDTTGTSTLWLDPDNTYNIVVTYGALNTSITITPTNNDFTITIGYSDTVVDFKYLFQGISYGVGSDNCWNASRNNSINFSILDSTNSIEWWGMDGIINGTHVFLYNNTTSSAGGTGIFLFNSSNVGVGGIVDVNIWFKRPGYSIWYSNLTYTIQNCTYAPGSIWGMIQGNLANSGLSDNTKAIVSIILSAVFSIAIIGYAGGGARSGGIVGVMLLGGFTFIGWFPPALYFIIIGTIIAIMALQWGRY
jgi:hypothetical protein